MSIFLSYRWKRGSLPVFLIGQIALFVAGCDMHSHAAFSTDKSRYRAGEEVILQIRNDFSGQMGYNLCTSQIEARVDTSWQLVEAEEERVCPMIENLLAPSRADASRFELYGNLPTGRYRFKTAVRLYAGTDGAGGAGRDTVLTTDPFQITE